LNNLTRILILVVLVLASACAMPSLPTSTNQGAAQPTATALVPEVAAAAPTAAPTTDPITDTGIITGTAPLTDSSVAPIATVETTAPVTESATVTTAGRTLMPTAVPDAAGTDSAPEGAAAPSAVVPPADAVAARLQVPADFAVRLFAEGLSKPRLMTIGPDGTLYVADQDAGTVVRLPDADGDGLADATEVVAEGLAGAHSLEWFDGWLYVASYGQVNRLQDGDGDGTFETQELVTDNIPGTGGHSSRTLHFGPDDKLYVAAGSSSNNEPESDPRRAAILRFNPDGTIPDDNPYASDADERRQAVWAEGLRNSVDFLFLPDGRLWANHNGSDMLGDNMPPEEIVIEVEAGEHYGWPYCYTPVEGVVPAGTEEVRDERVELNPAVLAACSEAVPALFTDLAHYAPLGMTQYNAPAGVDGFPAAYQGNLFVAYHGSWNSSDPRDCRVQMIVVQDGLPVESQPFLTGFRDSEEQQCSQAWGRPAATIVGADGALYVSDDQNGQIYRIVYTGAS
jgi:glucose/arabinose dehydrogenase